MSRWGWQYVACLAFGGLFISAACALGYIVVGQHTTYRTPAPCQHAATSAWSHLHALTDESGTRVPIEAIHADMAGLRACGVTR